MIGSISTSHLFLKFKNHLEESGNEKILFSAKYGAGKSTFLKEFFEQHQEYYAVTLSPVNYVINSSADIFELIKVDVIRQLFQDGLLTPRIAEEVSLSETLLATIKRDPIKILSQVADLASALSPAPSLLAAAAITNGVNSLLETIKSVEEKIKEKTGLQIHAEEYYDKPGTFLEYNIISQLLVSAIEEVKNLNRIPVLVIDDMDRMDPEHVFRILNVFSAHYNDHISGHKLGFNKVIVVAHYENLEQMYYHRYGLRTDFTGYIEKFYSSQLFRFDIRSAIKSQLLKLKLNLSEDSIKLLVTTLNYFIQVGEIKIRNLAKLDDLHLSELIEDVVFKTDFKNIFGKSKSNWPFPFTGKATNVTIRFSSFEEIQVLRILLIVFGDVEALDKAIAKPIHNRHGFVSHVDYERLLKSVLLLEHFLNGERSGNDIPNLVRSTAVGDFGRRNLDYPKSTIGEEWGYKIITTWNQGTPYIEDECYYKGAIVSLHHVPEARARNVELIFNIVRSHLNKIGEMNWLDKVQIASSQ